MTAATPALRFRGLRVERGGREVLHLDRLDVATTETLAVLGPNGSGKSTLLQSAALLLPAAEGSVALFGETPRRSRDRVRLRRMTSTVFQEPTLLDMSVTANVEVALAFHGVARGERRRRAEEWLDRLDVDRRVRIRCVDRLLPVHVLNARVVDGNGIAWSVRPSVADGEAQRSFIESGVALVAQPRRRGVAAVGVSAATTCHRRACQQHEGDCQN